MPTSNLALAPDVLNMVHQVPHKRILDVGPGRGKYSILLKEYVSGIEYIDAVEMWRPYIKDFRLRDLYDVVLDQDVTQLSQNVLDDYDIVLMVDILEHLSKRQGGELLKRIPGRVVICTPEKFFQNPEHKEIPPEAHRSVWTLQELELVRPLEVAYVRLGGVLARTAPLREV